MGRPQENLLAPADTLRCSHRHTHTQHTLRCSVVFIFVNPLPTLVLSDRTRIFGTVASSPRAAADRLLGCVGTARIDINYTKPPGPTPRRSARTLTLGVAQKAWSKASVNAVCDGDASRMRARHRDESTLHRSRHQCDQSVTNSNYHKPLLSSSRRWTLSQLLEVNHLFAHSTAVRGT